MNNRLILVVDDHPVNRRLPGMLLRGTAWRCEEAESGESALITLRERPFESVLLDISMPNMSGSDVCRIIKQSDDLKHLRVIAYTAHALDETRSAIMAAGFDAILLKPINRNSLLAVLDPESTPPAASA